MIEELTLADRLALHELPGIYGDAIDDRNWDELDRVFSPDAVFEVRGLVTMTGLADIKRYMEEEGQHPLAHLMTNIHIAVDESGVRLFSRVIAPVSRGGAPGKATLFILVPTMTRSSKQLLAGVSVIAYFPVNACINARRWWINDTPYLSINSAVRLR